MPFTGNSVVITATQLGAGSKMYIVPNANIGANNAAAVVHASLAEVGLSTEHMVDFGVKLVEVDGIQATGGKPFSVGGLDNPKLSFKMKAIPNTTALAAELNTFREAHLNKTPLWLMSLTGAEDEPGSFGMYGSWLITMKENKGKNNELIDYDVEAVPSAVFTHYPAAYQVAS